MEPPFQPSFCCLVYRGRASGDIAPTFTSTHRGGTAEIACAVLLVAANRLASAPASDRGSEVGPLRKDEGERASADWPLDRSAAGGGLRNAGWCFRRFLESTL